MQPNSPLYIIHSRRLINLNARVRKVAMPLVGLVIAVTAMDAAAVTFDQYLNPVGATDSNGVGGTFTPINLDRSNFDNQGTFNNAGRVFTGGLFDNFGFLNRSTAVFNNNGAASRLENLQGTNFGAINNTGTVRLNFIELSSGLRGSSNSELAGLDNNGTIDNQGSLFNHGHWNNSGTVTNRFAGQIVSHYNQFTFPNGTPSSLYDVEINNLAGAAIINTESDIVNGNQADAQLGIHSSTIINRGTVENIRGTITNYDTIKNFSTFENLTAFITNHGVIENSGSLSLERGELANFRTLRNNATISLIQDSQITNSGLIENNGTIETNTQSFIVNGDDIRDAGTIVNRGQFFNERAFGPLGTLFGGVSVSGSFQNIGGEVRNNHRFFVVNGGDLTTSGHFANTAGSDVVVDNGTFIVNFGGGILGGQGVTNNGTFTIQRGTLRNSSTFENQSQGVVSVIGQFTNNNVMTNAGNVTIFQSGKLSGDSVPFPPGAPPVFFGIYTQTGGKTLVNGTLLQAEIHNKGGVFAGSGSIIGHFFNEGGIIRPGDPVTLTIDGDLTFESGLTTHHVLRKWLMLL